MLQSKCQGLRTMSVIAKEMFHMEILDMFLVCILTCLAPVVTLVITLKPETKSSLLLFYILQNLSLRMCIF